ncbi:MAG: hypothetical protein Q8P50_19205 [Bacillota bacterium]|nr:hypothetical protein [Bacillota bacterium]
MDLKAWARQRGYAIAWGPPDLISEIKNEMEGRYEAGEVDPGLSRRYLRFSYTALGVDPIRQVGIAATPVPAHTIRFESATGAVTVLVPPTYVGDDSLTAAVIGDLACALGQDGIRAGVLSIPRKLLATRLGLANYGRNNIAYVPGMGSYVMLSPFATDQALEPRSFGGQAA